MAKISYLTLARNFFEEEHSQRSGWAEHFSNPHILHYIMSTPTKRIVACIKDHRELVLLQVKRFGNYYTVITIANPNKDSASEPCIIQHLSDAWVYMTGSNYLCSLAQPNEGHPILRRC